MEAGLSFIHDAILELLPKEELSLKPVDATAFDGTLNTAWKEEGIAAFHMQDDRLSQAERAVLCNMARRVRGVRGVV
jgi:hypothetical protein